MLRESKIYLFKDREDYISILSSDEVVNIIGNKGSGKTTTALKYIEDDNYIVINCDRLFELPVDNFIDDKHLVEVRNILKEKYKIIPNNEKFIGCYNIIVKYAKKKKKKLLIEGNVLCDISPITKLKGTIIVKRTGVLKCFIRTIKRDYPNEYFLNEEIKKHGKLLGKIYRFKNIVNRRKSIFKTYREIEKIIDMLEKGRKA